jgi:hypothetical protein
VLQSIRWSAINSLPAQRQQALLWLLQGKSEAALKEFSRLAVHGDTESSAWLATATLYAGQPAIALSGNIFFSQLATERMRRSRYMDYPLEVTIETLTSCNATCSFCPYPKLDRLGTRMSDELIDKIVGDLEAIPRDLPFGISPFKVNDPLLDKRIFDICAQITRRLPGAQPRLFTNASPMTDANIERIARIERLQHLWISLNECEPEAYQRVMGLPLERTLQRMDRLHAEVEAGRFPHPVIVSRVRSCTPDDDAFIAFVQQRFPRFRLRPLVRTLDHVYRQGGLVLYGWRGETCDWGRDCGECADDLQQRKLPQTPAGNADATERQLPLQRMPGVRVADGCRRHPLVLVSPRRCIGPRLAASGMVQEGRGI